MNFLKKLFRKARLAAIFWVRIVFAKSHFKVNIFIRLKYNFSGGFIADQYVLYDLKHNDKSEFLSEFDWHRSRYINEPFDYAFNNKVICADILKQYVRVAENLFIKNKKIIYNFKNGLRTNEDVLQCLSEKGKLIIKPFSLGKGNGVHMLRCDDSRFYIDEKEVSKPDLLHFLDKVSECIICEFIKQSAYADELYDKTANTIRLITMRDIRTHENKIFFAVQRIGTKQTIPVDNGSKGGLVSRIDLDTGILSEARSLHSTDVFYRHPDSGKTIKGIQIPGWTDIKKEILKVADKIPYMDFIAWDLLVTDNGICVIEANSSSGLNIIQLWGGQRKKELGDFFRYYGAIRK